MWKSSRYRINAVPTVVGKTQPFKTVVHILECELDPHKAEDWG